MAAKVMIKHLLFTYFTKEEGPDGETFLQERLARLGEEVDLSNARAQEVERGKENGAFYTTAESKAIKDGTYKGFDAETVYAARSGERPVPLIQDADNERSGDISALSAEEIAAVIFPAKFGEEGKKLNIEETVALAGDDDPDLMAKVIDAENLALDNDPRDGVVNALEAKMAAAAQQ